MPANNISLLKSMTLATNLIYTKIVERISSGNYPSDPKKMRAKQHPVEQSGNVTVGRVEVIGTTVFAYEFGSGLWAERGERAKYPIYPENSDMLAFKWPEASYAVAFDDQGRPLVTPGPDGEVVLPRVMHPGIRAQPFVEPTIRETADAVVELLGDEFLIQVSTALGPDVQVI